jgi:hypothetical protein
MKRGNKALGLLFMKRERKGGRIPTQDEAFLKHNTRYFSCTHLHIIPASILDL